MTRPKTKYKSPSASARESASKGARTGGRDGDLSASPPSRLLETVASVLMPLVRLLIARGVTYQAAGEMLKRVYVRAGQQHFAAGEASEEPTGTQLSLLTGLNRKEIRRLTDESVRSVAPEGVTSFAAAVHATWLTRRRFRDRNGAPRVLPRQAQDDKPSFNELVRTITTDHRPAALLEELRRLELVDLDDEGNASLRAQPFLSRRSPEDRLLPLAENLGDHAAAAVSNVLAETPPFLERSVFSDELSSLSVAHLQELVGMKWKRFHDELVGEAVKRENDDARAGRRQASSPPPSAVRQRAVIGHAQLRAAAKSTAA
jgi:hypothetical protein